MQSFLLHLIHFNKEKKLNYKTRNSVLNEIATDKFCLIIEMAAEPRFRGKLTM